MTTGRFSKWPQPSTDLRTLVLQIPPARIGLMTSILEAYDGVALMRTSDRKAGIIELWVMPGQMPLVESILTDLAKQFRIERLRELQGHPDLSTAEEEMQT